MLKKINIFTAGRQVSSTGFASTFTERDLQDMVESFNPEVHEPPIRVGHEDNDKVPAFGWVKKLQRIGRQLYAFIEFTPDMEDMIAKKHYKKVSASFYSPSSPSNPNQGKYTLRHVAMLGGQPPAVKGLEAFSFSEVEGIMTLDLDINFEEGIPNMEEKLKELEASFTEKLSEIAELQVKFAENNEVLDRVTALSSSVEELKAQFAEAEEKSEEDLANFKEQLKALTEEKLEEFGDCYGKDKKKKNFKEEEEPEAKTEVEGDEDEEEDDEDFGEHGKKDEEEDPEMGDGSYHKKGKKVDIEEEEEDPEMGDGSYHKKGKKVDMGEKEDETKKKMEEYAERIRQLEEFAEAQEAAKQAAELALEEQRKAHRREKIEADIEALYSEGKLTDGIYAQSDLLEYAVGLEEGTLEFSEGNTPADILISILGSIPAPVDFSEIADEKEAPELEEVELDFVEKVEKYATEKEMPFEEALRELSK